jgi:glycosyltransferase involved in cell wall biosynthesis
MASLELPQDDSCVHDDGERVRNMLVSVVIPTYNRAELLERAVNSVLSQTYPNLEVIIVDDASTDNTQDRIKDLQQVDHRIQYYRHLSNRGAQAARNTGIHAANGRYIAFLDSDNEWLPRKLEKQMALFSSKADSLGAVYCGYWEVASRGDVLNEYLPHYRGQVYKQALNEWLTDTSTLVVRKDVIEKIRGFDENTRAYQEWDICIRLARECEFDFVPDCLTIYHQHALPSISKDHLRDAYGYLGVVDNYQEEILRQCGKSALSQHYLKTGRLFIHAEQFDLARACFLKSIQYYPFNIKAMIHFGASLLGKGVYRSLRRLNKARYTSLFH